MLFILDIIQFLVNLNFYYNYDGSNVRAAAELVEHVQRPASSCVTTIINVFKDIWFWLSRSTESPVPVHESPSPVESFVPVDQSLVLPLEKSPIPVQESVNSKNRNKIYFEFKLRDVEEGLDIMLNFSFEVYSKLIKMHLNEIKLSPKQKDLFENKELLRRLKFNLLNHLEAPHGFQYVESERYASWLVECHRVKMPIKIIEPIFQHLIYTRHDIWEQSNLFQLNLTNIPIKKESYQIHIHEIIDFLNQNSPRKDKFVKLLKRKVNDNFEMITFDFIQYLCSYIESHDQKNQLKLLEFLSILYQNIIFDNFTNISYNDKLQGLFIKKLYQFYFSFNINMYQEMLRLNEFYYFKPTSMNLENILIKNMNIVFDEYLLKNKQPSSLVFNDLHKIGLNLISGCWSDIFSVFPLTVNEGENNNIHSLNSFLTIHDLISFNKIGTNLIENIDQEYNQTFKYSSHPKLNNYFNNYPYNCIDKRNNCKNLIAHIYFKPILEFTEFAMVQPHVLNFHGANNISLQDYKKINDTLVKIFRCTISATILPKI
jgi:hypothetical protein